MRESKEKKSTSVIEFLRRYGLNSNDDVFVMKEINADTGFILDDVSRERIGDKRKTNLQTINSLLETNYNKIIMILTKLRLSIVLGTNTNGDYEFIQKNKLSLMKNKELPQLSLNKKIKKVKSILLYRLCDKHINEKTDTFLALTVDRSNQLYIVMGKGANSNYLIAKEPEEEPRQEKLRQEELRQEELEQEELEQEELRQEELKQEEPRQEEPRQEEPRQEEPRQEELRQEEPKPETSQPLETTSQEIKSEEIVIDEPKIETIQEEQPIEEEPYEIPEEFTNAVDQYIEDTTFSGSRTKLIESSFIIYKNYGKQGIALSIDEAAHRLQPVMEKKNKNK